MEKNRTAFILVGLPASGKSTFRADLLKEAKPDVPMNVISTDDLLELVASASGKTYNEAFEAYRDDAEKMMWKGLDTVIKENHDIVIDRTNLTKKSRKKFISKIPPYYEIVAVIFETPPDDVWVARLNGRPGKNIPACVLEKMEESYEAPTVEEGFDKILTVKGW